MNFKDKKVLVVGLAKSGFAAIRVLNRLGANITLSEKKELTSQELDELNKLNVTVKGQDMEVFDGDFELAVKNPGIPPISPIVERLKQRNIPIWTEIELAFNVAKPQHYLTITGSNGKTTTTTILYEILKKAYGDKALVAGNIGTPLCEYVEKYNLYENEGYYIALEISNYQLVDIVNFRPLVSTIINLSPDHLETMGSLDNYYRSKMRVFENQKDDDLFLLNPDDELLASYLKEYKINCKIKTFSLNRSDTDAYIDDKNVYVDSQLLMPIKDIKLVGKHNIQNIMVASLMAKKVGICNQDIAELIRDFNGVEHRIEFVKELNGVKYYNDSKATNTDATITALKGFDSNVILLVGGHDKGLDMEPVKQHMACVKQVIGFGQAGNRLANDLSDKPIIVSDLNEAVKIAHDIAISGDVVLLSPTTSSFDQYTCFEQRGEHFKQLVNSYE